MENFLALEVWGLLIAGPCIACWVIGGIRGEARANRFYQHAFYGAQPGAVAVDERVQSSEQSDVADTAAVAPDALPLRKVSTDEALESEKLRIRREAFASMPDLDELRAQTDAIRRSEKPLQDPKMQACLRGEVAPSGSASIGVLAQYRQSIRDLRATNAEAPTPQPVVKKVQQAQLVPAYIPLRISDAAPLMLRTAMPDLIAMRKARAVSGYLADAPDEEPITIIRRVG
ncbi:MAG: hypothetical protein SXU28_05235 [Pseudomonadota bacterium]|nr:hypothetical protein [Pseudomonadota bacterium]